MPAITSYSTLQTAVSNYAGGSADTNFADAIQTCIALCEADLSRLLRIPEMVVRTLAEVDAAFETLPTDLIKLVSAAVIDEDDTEHPLLQVGVDAAPILARRLLYETGRPLYFVLHGAQLRLLPAASEDSAVLLRLVYFAKVPALSNAAPTNAVLSAVPDAYLYGTLAHLAEYLEDPSRLPRFNERFQAAVLAANRAAVLRDMTLAA